LAHDSSGSFWKQTSFRGNKLLEIVGSESPNELVRFQAAGDINLERYKNASANRKTLMDYNDPVMIKDLDDMSDQNLASHIRVKRNEPIVRRSGIGLLPQNSRRKTDMASTFVDSTFKGSYSDHENRSGTTMDIAVLHSRHKRGVLSKNGYRRKRVRENTGHSKYNVKMRNKKHGVLKSHNQLVTKKTNNPNSSMFSLIFHFKYIRDCTHFLLMWSFSS